MQIYFDPSSPKDYALFLRVKALPRYRIHGRTAEVPDEYASLLGLAPPPRPDADYAPSPFLFDYQRDISRLAIRKRKFAVFARCGLGKFLIATEFARHALSVLPTDRAALYVCPPRVIPQALREIKRFYGDSLPCEQVRASALPAWLEGAGNPGRFGITNYEAIKDGLRPGRLGCIMPDESSTPFKSHYGAWGSRLIDLGKGIDWKLCLTGTPAPNDRIEYASTAVFLDRFPTVNSFLARYFVNRGQTNERWELKPHALRPFYRSLSDWCIFLQDPFTYGWRDNVHTIPPIKVHHHDVPLTDEQVAQVIAAGGDMYGTPGGITSRAKLAQLAKGWHNGAEVPSNKPAFLKALVDAKPKRPTIIWCKYNAEQAILERTFPGAASIKGSTSEEEGQRLIDAFMAGDNDLIITKPDCLGFGLNLQRCTRQIFSTLQDSYEEYAQCVGRSNRVGSTEELHVHLPVTSIERPMVETVLRKAHRVEEDMKEQERLFKEVGHVAL